MEAIRFLLPPFTASILLIGILGYFGIHVLKRGIIFIDIAMAQIATLGMTCAFILKIDPESPITYVLSLFFITLASYIFASLRCQRQRICIEAIIGISYAVAATAAVILIDKAAGSEEHLKEMLIGSILWVKWPEILGGLILYSLIGAIHFRYREKFLMLSENYQSFIKNHLHVRMWDFIFYLTLGIVVMHTVRIGGILMVFSFLIIPSAISATFSNKWFPRILFGWTIGTLTSVIGLIFSWKLDVPSAPVVVISLGLMFLIVLVIQSIKPEEIKTLQQDQAA